MPESLNETELREWLNQQTGKCHWKELERHFARGVLIHVDAKLDLVEVAVRVIRDDKNCIREWLEAGLLENAAAEQARRWSQENTLFWTVVAAPWVLVQVSGENG